MAIAMLVKGQYQCAIRTFQDSLAILKAVCGTPPTNACLLPSSLTVLRQTKVRAAATFLSHMSRKSYKQQQTPSSSVFVVMESNDTCNLFHQATRFAVESQNKSLEDKQDSSSMQTIFPLVLIRDTCALDAKATGELESGIILYNYAVACLFVASIQSPQQRAELSSSSVTIGSPSRNKRPRCMMDDTMVPESSCATTTTTTPTASPRPTKKMALSLMMLAHAAFSRLVLRMQTCIEQEEQACVDGGECLISQQLVVALFSLLSLSVASHMASGEPQQDDPKRVEMEQTLVYLLEQVQGLDFLFAHDPMKAPPAGTRTKERSLCHSSAPAA